MPHMTRDSFFKLYFSDPEVIADLVSLLGDEPWASRVDLSSISPDESRTSVLAPRRLQRNRHQSRLRRLALACGMVPEALPRRARLEPERIAGRR